MVRTALVKEKSSKGNQLNSVKLSSVGRQTDLFHRQRLETVTKKFYIRVSSSKGMSSR